MHVDSLRTFVQQSIVLVSWIERKNAPCQAALLHLFSLQALCLGPQALDLLARARRLGSLLLHDAFQRLHLLQHGPQYI